MYLAGILQANLVGSECVLSWRRSMRACILPVRLTATACTSVRCESRKRRTTLRAPTITTLPQLLKRCRQRRVFPAAVCFGGASARKTETCRRYLVLNARGGASLAKCSDPCIIRPNHVQKGVNFKCTGSGVERIRPYETSIAVLCCPRTVGCA
ncbi:hypothetical protein P280DRAFT_326248 [Massarina eburnea CBS 473.64]|uniref:Uncharacterized protein n=1 Tax=Massarina eburnea CBS 473.64 TaxID=1395130 RepID=A0A6A6S105_9PLEO|nr:hypothetical protein P280DRAFT_326248 [Massarina eburnea CBS 473.64]